MLRWVFVPILGLVAAFHTPAQSAIQDPHCTGVLQGVISGQRGQPAQGINVVAWPLGVDLGTMLPDVKTDEAGEYRFAQLCPGTYTVVPSDNKAGFEEMSPEYFELLSGKRLKKVKLARRKWLGNISLELPPAPARMSINVSNRASGADVKRFRVRIIVPGQRRASKLEIIFSPEVADSDIQVPPDEHFTLRVVAEGFREGTSETYMLQPGARWSLHIQLEPRKPKPRKTAGH